MGTFIILVSVKGNPEMVNAMLPHISHFPPWFGAAIQTAFTLASLNGKTDVADMLQRRYYPHSNPNTLIDAGRARLQNEGFLTFLIETAVLFGDKNLVQFLYSEPFHPDQPNLTRDLKLQNALRLAIEYEKFEVADAIIDSRIKAKFYDGEPLALRDDLMLLIKSDQPVIVGKVAATLERIGSPGGLSLADYVPFAVQSQATKVVKWILKNSPSSMPRSRLPALFEIASATDQPRLLMKLSPFIQSLQSSQVEQMYQKAIGSSLSSGSKKSLTYLLFGPTQTPTSMIMTGQRFLHFSTMARSQETFISLMYRAKEVLLPSDFDTLVLSIVTRLSPAYTISLGAHYSLLPSFDQHQYDSSMLQVARSSHSDVLEYVLRVNALRLLSVPKLETMLSQLIHHQRDEVLERIMNDGLLRSRLTGVQFDVAFRRGVRNDLPEFIGALLDYKLMDLSDETLVDGFIFACERPSLDSVTMAYLDRPRVWSKFSRNTLTNGYLFAVMSSSVQLLEAMFSHPKYMAAIPWETLVDHKNRFGGVLDHPLHSLYSSSEFIVAMLSKESNARKNKMDSATLSEIERDSGRLTKARKIVGAFRPHI